MPLTFLLTDLVGNKVGFVRTLTYRLVNYAVESAIHHLNIWVLISYCYVLYRNECFTGNTNKKAPKTLFIPNCIGDLRSVFSISSLERRHLYFQLLTVVCANSQLSYLKKKITQWFEDIYCIFSY